MQPSSGATSSADLLAVAAEFGDTAVDALRTLLACYEALRAHGDNTADPAAYGE